MVIDQIHSMKNLKVISFSFVVLFLSVVITSNISLSSSDNQAYATVENTDQEVSDSIKKACPNYESNNNNNIKGLVTDMLKACLHQGNQPPTTPGPNQGTFAQNIMQFTTQMLPGTDSNDVDTADIVITDTTSDLSKSYRISPSDRAHTDQFVIPIGDNYKVTVDVDSIKPSIYEVVFQSFDCKQVNPNIDECTGTMGTSTQSILVALVAEGSI